MKYLPALMHGLTLLLVILLLQTRPIWHGMGLDDRPWRTMWPPPVVDHVLPAVLSVLLLIVSLFYVAKKSWPWRCAGGGLIALGLAGLSLTVISYMSIDR